MPSTQDSPGNTRSPEQVIAACEEMRSQIHQMQQQLPTTLASMDPSINETAATSYNDALFHLQSAREELRGLVKALQSKNSDNS